MSSTSIRLRTTAAAAALLAALPLAAYAAVPSTDEGSLPAVTPTPQLIARWGADVTVPDAVAVVAGDDVDTATTAMVSQVLAGAGAAVVEVVAPGAATAGAELVVRVGDLDRPDVAAALDQLGAGAVPPKAEGYVLVADAASATVVLGGLDGDGTYYAAQTLRQLVVGDRIAGARVVDHPAMPLRGTIEGFYGSPWTHEERLDQLAFYGDVKLNTYIYAPKDDPYHRSQWRTPYPPADLARLRELVTQATEHHVQFTFALSPGVSICYSDPAHYSDLVAKLQAMYDIGVRAFSIPLDDISTSQWACPQDYAMYGLPGTSDTVVAGTHDLIRGTARAQVDLLNRLQSEFVEAKLDVASLQTVPTQYDGLSDSPYKKYWRTYLDPEVVVMWTGTDVVPAKITNAEAQTASQRFGRELFLWDNYPVNDYEQTAGRLLLAPYDHREAGLSQHLKGIVANPMNQAAASKVSLFTVADFTWNDRTYDRNAAWAEAARYLAGGDAATAAALLVFFDLNHKAPTFGTTAWQPQSPGLAASLAAFTARYDAGDRGGAIATLRSVVVDIAGAPEAIRAGVADDLLLSDAEVWLDATNLWGDAATAYLDALEARLAGDGDRAAARLADGKALVTQAKALEAPAGENRWNNRKVKIADGVLDVFLVGLEPRIQG